MTSQLKYGIGLFLIFFLVNISLLFFSLLAIESFEFSLAIKFFIGMIAVLASSAISAIVVIFGVSFFRNFLSSFRCLIRLENLSHPLMIKLSTEAPGTYQHSLMAANIAYKTAKIVRANALLCRVSSYYHDIGKIKSSQYFIENQSPSENIHNKLNNPKKSAEIIINHVKEGSKLAEENHLSEEIKNIIEQHHGTSLVGSFYSKAKEKDPETKEEDFRYLGPKPMSKEAAIVMLADSLEAQIRLHSKLTDQIIEQLVEKVIRDKTNDKQLELAQINNERLKEIGKAMIESLKSIFHSRIEY